MSKHEGIVTCPACGREYDAQEQKPPEDSEFIWTPKCPECGWDVNSPEPSPYKIGEKILRYRQYTSHDSEGAEVFLDTAQMWARHIHNRD